MDKDNNNSPDLQSMINDLPEVKKEVEIVENDLPKPAPVEQVGEPTSAFDDMAVSTPAVENAKKPETMANAPIAEEPKPVEPTPVVPNVEEPKSEFTLNAQTIGTVKPDKQKSPIAMIVLFGILLLFMIFMPEVLNYVNKTFGTNLQTHSGVKIPEVVEQEEKPQEITMYDLNDDTVITLDKISFQTFVKSIEDTDYKLSFTIKNSGTQLYSFSKKLYFEFYDNSKTFLGRSYLENVKDITGGVSNHYQVDINKDIYDKATKIELVQRTDDDYPAVELTSSLLTCTNSKYNIVYSFDTNQRLSSIKDMFTYTKPDDIVAYSTDLVSYKAKIDNLDRLDGVTAVLAENETGFITTIAIDYKQADYSQLSSDTKYYQKDTYARIIKFEMSAKGYNCR